MYLCAERVTAPFLKMLLNLLGWYGIMSLKATNGNLEGSIMSEKVVMNWIIAIIVAVVYLLVSSVFNAWAYTWVIWVAYAIYRLVVK